VLTRLGHVWSHDARLSRFEGTREVCECSETATCIHDLLLSESLEPEATVQIYKCIEFAVTVLVQHGHNCEFNGSYGDS
jgi:hypothetical protein